MTVNLQIWIAAYMPIKVTVWIVLFAGYASLLGCAEANSGNIDHSAANANE